MPFITHGGYGIGQSLAVVTEHAPGARLAEAFVKQADQGAANADGSQPMAGCGAGG